MNVFDAIFVVALSTVVVGVLTAIVIKQCCADTRTADFILAVARADYGGWLPGCDFLSGNPVL